LVDYLLLGFSSLRECNGISFVFSFIYIYIYLYRVYDVIDFVGMIFNVDKERLHAAQQSKNSMTITVDAPTMYVCLPCHKQIHNIDTK
jgi:hypothetical protein